MGGWGLCDPQRNFGQYSILPKVKWVTRPIRIPVLVSNLNLFLNDPQKKIPLVGSVAARVSANARFILARQSDLQFSPSDENIKLVYICHWR